MAKYVRSLTYKGREILFMDARGVSGEEGIAAWDEMKQEVLKRHDTHLRLIDGRDIAITPAIVRKAKDVAEMGRGQSDIRVAFVGLSGLQKSTAQLIAKGVNLRVHFCDALEEGKEWLIKEDDGLRGG